MNTISADVMLGLLNELDAAIAGIRRAFPARHYAISELPHAVSKLAFVRSELLRASVADVAVHTVERV